MEKDFFLINKHFNTISEHDMSDVKLTTSSNTYILITVTWQNSII